jgi:hypothetical protein
VAEPGGDQLSELRSSARGWHGAQLAVLGFIGLCGVLQSQTSSAAPRWLEIVAGLLVLAALVLSCVSIALVASVAWPVPRFRPPGEHGEPDAEQLRRGATRLRTGVALTFVAVAVLALAATSSWWPSPSAQPGLVTVTTSSGTLCGSLVESEPGWVGIKTQDQGVKLRLTDVVELHPVEACRA